MDNDQPNNSYIDLVQYFCPNTVDNADIRSHFEGLEIALRNHNGTHVPHLAIYCGTHKTASTVSRLLLEGNIFPQYLGEFRKVSLYHRGASGRVAWLHIEPDEILSTPTHFTLDGITISLNTAQRAEWLVSMDFPSDRRGQYLRNLLEASRAVTAAPDAASQLGTPTLPDAEVGVSAQTGEDAEYGGQVNKDGDETEEDGPDPAGTAGREGARTGSGRVWRPGE